MMTLKVVLLLLTLVVDASIQLTLNRTTSRAQVDIEYFYTANNDVDGDFIISQLIPEITEPESNLLLLVLPLGDVQIISDSDGNIYCHSAESLCSTNLIHVSLTHYTYSLSSFFYDDVFISLFLQFCVQLQYSFIVPDFIRCHFQSELYPTDLIGASKQCFNQLISEEEWEKLLNCSQDADIFSQYASIVKDEQQIRPLFEQSPHVYLNEQYNELAPIDLKKALCRVQVSDYFNSDLL